MKNKLILLFLFGISGQLFAGFNGEEICFIPWGSNDNSVKKELFTEGQYGPLSFQIDGNICRVMDNQNGMIKTYTSGKYTGGRSLAVKDAIDFYKLGESCYYLTPTAVYLEKEAACKLIYSSKDARHILENMEVTENRLQMTDGDEIIISSGKTIRRMDRAESPVFVKRISRGELGFTVNKRLNILSADDLGTVEYLGSANKMGYYIYVEEITRHVPLQVVRSVWLVSGQGNIISKLQLPQEQETYMYRMFRVVDGKLYHMHASSDGLHLFKWSVDDEKTGSEAVYPEKFHSSRHFNNLGSSLKTSLDNKTQVNRNSSVSRTEALAIGDEFVQHGWIATSDNIGTTSTVTTPSWITVGMNKKIPYKWGGWNTVAEFDAGIAAGKLAGDKNTSTVDWGNSVGADCSGFVSVCWKTDHKYGTSTISGCSYQLSDYNDLLPGDATNNSGSHIRMFVEWTSTGLLKQVEETSGGGAVWGARYYNWRTSDISSYVPIRYNFIEGIGPMRPELSAVTAADDSISVFWSAEDDPNTTQYRVYGRQDSGDDFALLGSVSALERSFTLADTFSYNLAVQVTAYNELSLEESNASDIYSCRTGDDTCRILFVDGFDRNGSYSGLTHGFMEWTAETVRQHNISLDGCSNDALLSGEVNLSDYYMVWWILGDESTADETFSSDEQILVKDYLIQGGRMFVSGSEISWDLDNKGSSSDKDFIHNVLKTKYVADDSDSYTVNGVGDLSDLTLTFSKNGNGKDNYPEDYPDVLGSNGGSSIVLKYANGKTAATFYEGIIDTGNTEAKVMVMGFPFETIVGFDKRDETASYILHALGYSEIETENLQMDMPMASRLLPNYPNPFNPVTNITYELSAPGQVELLVYDLSGRYVGNLAGGYRSAGSYTVNFDGTSMSSGVYVYRLKINGKTQFSRKMLLVK